MKSSSIVFWILFLLNGITFANEGNLPPVAVLTEDPDRTWFYNGEQVVFSSTSSSDPDGYVNYSKFYVNGVLKKSSSYTISYATCFVLYGSGITGCHELGNGATTVSIKLGARDNSGEWDYQTISYTIQERKGRRYFIADHLGSVRATVDDKGEVVGYDDFYPFGKVMPGRSSNSSNPNDLYKFTGHERDEEAGLTLDYMNARNYDPIIGRFLQIDPLSDQFPAWNPYHYVYNNPLGFTDPTGMSPENQKAGARNYSGVNVINSKDCPKCKIKKAWDNFISTVGEVLKNAEVSINFNFGEDGEITATNNVSQAQSMISNAMLADMKGRADVVEAAYNALGYVPGADVAQDLYEGDYLEAGLNAASYFIPVGKMLGPGLKIANNKLVQHAYQWGIGKKGNAISTHELAVMQRITQHIYKNSTTIRQSSWGNPAAGGFSNALFYSNGSHIVVTQSDGTMITLLKNAMGNKHFNNATTLWTK